MCANKKVVPVRNTEAKLELRVMRIISGNSETSNSPKTDIVVDGDECKIVHGFYTLRPPQYLLLYSLTQYLKRFLIIGALSHRSFSLIIHCCMMDYRLTLIIYTFRDQQGSAFTFSFTRHMPV